MSVDFYMSILFYGLMAFMTLVGFYIIIDTFTSRMNDAFHSIFYILITLSICVMIVGVGGATIADAIANKQNCQQTEG